MFFALLCSAWTVALPSVASSTWPADAVFSFVMVDRFADGAPNDVDVEPGQPRRFQGGDLRGLRERLPYLAALGVTHVWITPVAAQVDGLVGAGADATAAYHGYWPRDLEGIDRHFGTDDDLRALVADARASKIGIVLDVVVNHLGYGAPDPSALMRSRCGDTDETRCLFGLPDLRTEDPRVRDVVVERTVGWARRFNVAGFRIDALKHIGHDVARAVREGGRAARPGLFAVGEHWGASPQDDSVRAIVEDGAADAVIDFSLAGLAREWVTGRMRSAAFVHHLLARDRALQVGPPMLGFLDNHDVETWAHAVGRRSLLGAPLLLFDRAVPVITYGTELGRLGGAGDPENRSFMPWAEAARAETEPGHPLHVWRKLVHLRRTHAVVRRGALSVLAEDGRPVPGAGEPFHKPPPHDVGFVVLQRAEEDARALVAIARGQRLVHVQTLSRGERIVDVVASSGGTARIERGRLVLQVAADGFVAVVIAGGGTP